MKYLLPVFACLDYPRFIASLGTKMKLRKELFGGGGFDGIEFDAYFTGVLDGNWNINYSRLNRVLTHLRNIYTIHACFETPFEIRPFVSFNKLNIAETSKNNEIAIKKHIDLVKHLVEHEKKPVVPECPLLIFHPGRCKDTERHEKALENLADNLLFAVAYAEGRPVSIGLENLPPIAFRPKKEGYPFRHLGTSAEEFEFLFEFDALKKNLKVVLDIGHSNVTGTTEKFILAFKEKIRHVHISWNDGTWDQALPLPKDGEKGCRQLHDVLRLLFESPENPFCESMTFEIAPIFLSDYVPSFKQSLLRDYRFMPDVGGSIQEIIESMRAVKKFIQGL